MVVGGSVVVHGWKMFEYENIDGRVVFSFERGLMMMMGVEYLLHALVANGFGESVAVLYFFSLRKAFFF